MNQEQARAWGQRVGGKETALCCTAPFSGGHALPPDPVIMTRGWALLPTVPLLSLPGTPIRDFQCIALPLCLISLEHKCFLSYKIHIKVTIITIFNCKFIGSVYSCRCGIQGAFFFFFLFWPCSVACGLLVPKPGIKPRPLAVNAWSPNHWTTRKFQQAFF